MTEAIPGPSGYWPSRWPGEDGGPRRLQHPGHGRRSRFRAGRVDVTRARFGGDHGRAAGPGEVFLLRHTFGPDAHSWVERIDPVTLEPLARSDDLAGGPTWPGGLAAHTNGSLYVVFGNHAHRLSADLRVLASRELPRRAPYNSFVILPDGHLVTKDFGGVLPGHDPRRTHAAAGGAAGARAGDAAFVGRCELPEPSIARLSADGDTVYVGRRRRRSSARAGTARSSCSTTGSPRATGRLPGQTYGWDAVLALGAAWFLDNGEGSERYAGTFRGLGISAAPLHLVRVDLATGAVALTEICGAAERAHREPARRRRRPPHRRRLRQQQRGACRVRHRRRRRPHAAVAPEQHHACHLLLFADTGELVTNDHDADRMVDAIVVLDIETGRRAGCGSRAGAACSRCCSRPPGSTATSTTCSFTTLTRVSRAT